MPDSRKGILRTNDLDGGIFRSLVMREIFPQPSRKAPGDQKGKIFVSQLWFPPSNPDGR
jgi:hypothetical protein